MNPIQHKKSVYKDYRKWSLDQKIAYLAKAERPSSRRIITESEPLYFVTAINGIVVSRVKHSSHKAAVNHGWPMLKKAKKLAEENTAK